MRRAARLALLATAVLAPLALPLNAQIHRCVLADGRVEYRDRACPGDARQSTPRTIAAPQSALRAAMGPWRCAADPAARTHPVFASTVQGAGIEALPAAQRTALKNALQGVALGHCGLHGQGCGDLGLSLHRERNGTVFVCLDGSRPGELKVLPDGRIVQRRGDETQGRVLDPRVPPDHADSHYRVDLDGNRVDAAPRRSSPAPALEVLERER
jgi:hypothetical protein